MNATPTPFRRFCNGLHQVRSDFNEQLDEMLAFAEVMAMKQNSIELDNDTWYVTAAGTLDEIIPVVYQQIERLERIRKQRDGQH
jgi:hypothetical protein